MHRNTYAIINVNNLKENINKIIKNYPNYKYYFAVVKADCYGHGIKPIKDIIKEGINYLAVATLDEALEIRKEIKNIPILCLGIIPIEHIKLCEKNNITITISSVEYAKQLVQKNKYKNLKAHLKINTGMNRLGMKTENDIINVYNILRTNNIKVEGVYTHIYNALVKKDTKAQLNTFKNLVKNLPKDKIPIFHTSASDALVLYDKLDFINGCRLGIIMYGFSKDKTLNLKSTIQLVSEVIQINELQKDEIVGYNALYKAQKKEKIAVIPCGYADGIIRKNTGREVYINNKKYKIVGNICMDMLFVKVDKNVKQGDKVYILKDINHIKKVSKHLETIPYEILTTISKRVPRIYK